MYCDMLEAEKTQKGKRLRMTYIDSKNRIRDLDSSDESTDSNAGNSSTSITIKNNQSNESVPEGVILPSCSSNIGDNTFPKCESGMGQNKGQPIAKIAPSKPITMPKIRHSQLNKNHSKKKCIKKNIVSNTKILISRDVQTNPGLLNWFEVIIVVLFAMISCYLILIYLKLSFQDYSELTWREILLAICKKCKKSLM